MELIAFFKAINITSFLYSESAWSQVPPLRVAVSLRMFSSLLCVGNLISCNLELYSGVPLSFPYVYQKNRFFLDSEWLRCILLYQAQWLFLFSASFFPLVWSNILKYVKVHYKHLSISLLMPHNIPVKALIIFNLYFKDGETKTQLLSYFTRDTLLKRKF